MDERMMDRIAEEYEKTGDCQILREFSKSTDDYQEKLSFAQRYCLVTFECFYNKFLEASGRLN